MLSSSIMYPTFSCISFAPFNNGWYPCIACTTSIFIFSNSIISFSLIILIFKLLFASATSFVEYIIIFLFNFSNISVLQWSECLCVIKIISTLFQISKYSSLYFKLPGSTKIFFILVWNFWPIKKSPYKRGFWCLD